MKSAPDSQGRSVRLLRIGEQIRHALAEVLSRGDLRDDLLSHTIVSVSEVRVSPDLRHATAFVQPLGAAEVMPVVKALASHARYLRGEVARRMSTKYTPELRFRPDESFEAGARIDKILRSPKVARDLKPDAPAPSDDDGEDED